MRRLRIPAYQARGHVHAVKLVIATDNTAFEASAGHELARILRDVADALETHGVDVLPLVLQDRNGNTVGKAVRS